MFGHVDGMINELPEIFDKRDSSTKPASNNLLNKGNKKKL